MHAGLLCFVRGVCSGLVNSKTVNLAEVLTLLLTRRVFAYHNRFRLPGLTLQSSSTTYAKSLVNKRGQVSAAT